MNKLVSLVFGIIALTGSAATLLADTDARCFEMRTYQAAEGKLDAVHARFRDHTLALFEKHGMTNLGYFVPIGANPERKLVFFLAYPSRAAREKAWADFWADPAWLTVYKASEENGKLVAKAETVYLDATDYSPLVRAEGKGKRVFELRTYTTPPGRLEALNARFRDHTLKLFAKHGMTNVAYWTPAVDQQGALNPPDPKTTLIYLLAHPSEPAAKTAFERFVKDPEWKKVQQTSEASAGGPLTAPRGITSVFLEPTDYSAVR